MGSPVDFPRTLSLLVVCLLSCYQVLAESQSDAITCFYYDGSQAANNTLCPGSSSCCGITATCVSNRLCHNEGDASNTYVRGPCAIDGWDSSCAQVCLYDETTGIFPRVTQCDNGSWCCNNDVSCCASGTGVFLDATGEVATKEATVTISYPPASGTSTGRLTVTPTASTTSSATTSSTSTTSSISAQISDSSTSGSSSTPSATSSTTATSAAASTSAASSSSSSSGLQIGLGVGLGVPLAAILCGAAVWMFLRKRKKAAAAGSTGPQSDFKHTPYQPFYDPHKTPEIGESKDAHQMDSMPSRVHEMEGVPRAVHEMGPGQVNRVELA